jgi:putative hydrolase of the HAD superfamily
LGVISNSEGRIEAFIERVGLRPFFQFVLDSELVGVRKPDPEIFRLALQLAQASPHEALFVGDVYTVDILGARRVGMEPVLFNPFISGDGYDCPTIRHLSDVISILQGREL